MLRWILLICCLSTPAGAAEPDWRPYGRVLEGFVAPGELAGIKLNLVDYSGLRNSADFAGVVAAVRKYDVRLLRTREEKLAFYINAYNILTIQLILDKWPVASIRDIGNFLKGPWDIVMLENADGKLSLDDIEHKIIRSFGEPRIHFAVNCASISCPNIRLEPYTVAQLDRQLTLQAQEFLAEPGKGLSLTGKVAHTSRIFDWYKSDFKAGGGVAGFVRKYAPGVTFTDIKTDLDYNWQLNGS